MPTLCPHTEPFRVNGVDHSAREVIDGLVPFLTGERVRRIDEVVANRTYTVVPVMEGLYDHGNVNAVLRSAEALGYQAVHNINSSENFKRAGRITQGAENWLDLKVWQSTPPCIEYLKERGYRILATRFKDATPIAELRFDTPAAIVFGNEKDGLSRELVDAADESVVIPMAGFTKSFNISVAAALCLYHVQQDRMRRQGRHGDLSQEERDCLTASFYLRNVPKAAMLLARARQEGIKPPGE